jgi:hypothetical protein
MLIVTICQAIKPRDDGFVELITAFMAGIFVIIVFIVFFIFAFLNGPGPR